MIKIVHKGSDISNFRLHVFSVLSFSLCDYLSLLALQILMIVTDMLCGKDHENDIEYQPLRFSSPGPWQAKSGSTKKRVCVSGVCKVWKNLGWAIVIAIGLVG